MRKNFGVKPFTYPQPVFIIATYNEDGTPNAMNAAWGGISEMNQIFICLDDTHKTAENILSRKAFTVSMGDAKNVIPCDYVGVVSGHEEPNKFEKAGFTALPSEFVDAPLIKELPMAVECKLISYNQETCFLLGEIINVNADESILDENGTINPEKFHPIIFDPMNNTYLKIGEKVGNAFSDGLQLKK